MPGIDIMPTYVQSIIYSLKVIDALINADAMPLPAMLSCRDVVMSVQCSTVVMV